MWFNVALVNSTDLLLVYHYSENRATSQIWLVLPNMFCPPIWGEKWWRSEHAHASYPGLFFRPPWFSPYIEGGKKGEFRDWTSSRLFLKTLRLACKNNGL